MFEWVVYLGAGVMAGTVAGLFGVGGGLIIVPILWWVFNWQGIAPDFAMHLAIGTSLMTICFTSLSSIYAHHQHGHIQWGVAKQFVMPLLIGSFIGAVVAANLASDQLKVIFAFFVLFAAIRIWLPITASHTHNLKQPLIYTLYGSLTGLISAIVGIGGGTLMVPFLLFAGENMKQAVGTAAACGFPIAVSGALGFMLMGERLSVDSSSWQTGFIHWQGFLGIISTSLIFARLGAGLAKSLPAEILKKGFSILLMMIAVSLFIS